MPQIIKTVLTKFGKRLRETLEDVEKSSKKEADFETLRDALMRI